MAEGDSTPPASRKPTPVRSALAVVQVLVGIALLTWLLSRVDLQALRTLAGDGSSAQLVIGLVLLFVAFPGLQALRMHVLIVRYTKRLAGTLEVFFVGAFFNNVLPSNVGGDAVRLMYLKRGSSDWGGPLAMLFLHRVSGLEVLLIAALLSVIVRQDTLAQALPRLQVSVGHMPSGLFGAAVAAGVVVVVGALAFRRVREALARRLGKLWSDSRRAMAETSRRTLTNLTLITLAFHLVRAVAIQYVLAYFGQDTHLLDLVVVLAATAIAALIPISVGGIGVMEGTLSVGLVAYGVAPSAAIATALVNRLVLLANAAVGGVVYVMSRKS